MPYGEYAFQSTGCTGAVTMTITYPQPLPAGIQFWKYGPATPAVGGVVAASTWFQLGSATLSSDRQTVTYTITDNGAGDSDATLGRISDPFALAAGPVGGGSSHPRGCALGTGAAVCRTGPPRMAEAAGLGEGMKIFRTFIAAELIAASAYP